MQMHIGYYLIFLGIIAILLLGLIHHYRDSRLVYSAIVLIGIGGLRLLLDPISLEIPWTKLEGEVYIKGHVQSIQVTEYGTQAVLNHVTIGEGNNQMPTHLTSLKSKVMVAIGKDVDLGYKEWIEGYGVWVQQERMNSFEMDYESYQKSQGILGTLKLKSFQIEKTKPKKWWILKEQIRKDLYERIDKLFGEHSGVIKAMLIGDTTQIPESTLVLYQETGLAHVLSISGFHMNLIATVILGVGRQLGLGYTRRRISVIGVTWSYALLTGASISTLRACMMLTTGLVAQCIWEEEDALTTLAVAAAIILIKNPFQLMQAGFLLSFGAVLGLIISREILNNLEERHKRFKGDQFVLSTLGIIVTTYPILAYYFYQVPGTITFCNLVMMPVFSTVILLAWISLGLSYIQMGLAVCVASLVKLLLTSVENITTFFLKMPGALWITGRPKWITYGVLMIIVILGIASILGRVSKQKCGICCGILISLYLMIQNSVSVPLEITTLYIGQGDSTAVILKEKRVILIDAGNEKQGNRIEKFLKYKGLKGIEFLILSHSHDDHLGGTFELLKKDIPIKALLISEKEKEILEPLVKLARSKGTKVYTLDKGDSVGLGPKLTFKCLAPTKDTYSENANNLSMVLQLSYEKFLGLFMGDLEKEEELKLVSELEDIHFLKVGHHGSDTSTTEAFLETVRPEYAFISCGKNNIYHHPADTTLERLNKMGVLAYRTDQEGGLTLTTDGKRVCRLKTVKGVHEDERKYLLTNGK